MDRSTLRLKQKLVLSWFVLVSFPVSSFLKKENGFFFLNLGIMRKNTSRVA